MRFSLLAVMLCSGTAVLCHAQGLELTQQDPAKERDWFEHARSDMESFPQGWHVDFSRPFQMPQSATPKETVRTQNPNIDSRCILHPPQKALGSLSPATPILQNRYPGLKIMPVDAASGELEARVEGIPVQWPGLKLDSIPGNWPKLLFTPVTEENQPLPQSPRK